MRARVISHYKQYEYHVVRLKCQNGVSLDVTWTGEGCVTVHSGLLKGDATNLMRIQGDPLKKMLWGISDTDLNAYEAVYIELPPGIV